MLPLAGCVGPIERLINPAWATALPEDPLATAIPKTKYVPIPIPTFTYANQKLPGFTTGNGLRGDPINVMVLADIQTVLTGFSQAGWIQADPISLANLQKQGLALSHRISYPAAPVSDLFVFGRSQDVAFEKNSENIDVRDHLRIWVSPVVTRGELVFLVAGSKDAGIKRDPRTGLPTHAIDPDLDKERNVIVADLLGTKLFHALPSTPNATESLSGQNVGGDTYHSDGQIAVVEGN